MTIFLAVVATFVGVFLVTFLIVYLFYRKARAKIRALHEWGVANGWQVAAKPSPSIALPDAFIDRILVSDDPAKVKVNSVLSHQDGDRDQLAFNVTGLVRGYYRAKAGHFDNKSGQFERRLGAVAVTAGQGLPDFTLVDPGTIEWAHFKRRTEQTNVATPGVDVLEFYRLLPDNIDRLPPSFTPETIDRLLRSPFCLHIEQPWVVAVFPDHLSPEDVGRGLELLRALLATMQPA